MQTRNREDREDTVRLLLGALAIILLIAGGWTGNLLLFIGAAVFGALSIGWAIIRLANPHVAEEPATMATDAPSVPPVDEQEHA